MRREKNKTYDDGFHGGDDVERDGHQEAGHGDQEIIPPANYSNLHCKICSLNELNESILTGQKPLRQNGPNNSNLVRSLVKTFNNKM